MKKYQHETVLKFGMQRGSEEEYQFLKTFGETGWQLCAVMPTGQRGENTLYYFKREIDPNI